MRIGVLTSRPVDPTRSASQARVCFLLHALLEQGHEVWHIHTEETGYDLATFLRGLAAVYPTLHLLGFTRDLPAGLDALILSDLWLEPALEAALAVARPVVRGTGTALVFDSTDCLTATFAGSWPAERLVRLGNLESEIRSLANLSVFVSVSEVLKAERLDPQVRQSNCFVLPTCHVVSPLAPSFGSREHVCFVGSEAPHNVAAAVFFVQRVWPRLQTLLPEVEFHLLGAVADRLRVQGPAELAKRIRTVGWVSDLAATLGRYRVSVVPMVGGSGIKGKTLDSLACGTPVVTTILGAEGMPLVHQRHAVLAEANEGFADAVASVYRDEQRWVQLSEEGRRLVERRFSPSRFRQRVRELVERVRGLRAS